MLRPHRHPRPARKFKVCMPTPDEDQIHKAVADFLELALKAPVTWTTIGHGGGGVARGAKLKRLGLKPGWPDVQILVPNGTGSLTLYIGIELKTKDGAPSEDQLRVHGEIRAAGGHVFICRGVDDVHRALVEMRVPLHADPFGKGFIRRATA